MAESFEEFVAGIRAEPPLWRLMFWLRYLHCRSQDLATAYRIGADQRPWPAWQFAMKEVRDSLEIAAALLDGPHAVPADAPSTRLRNDLLKLGRADGAYARAGRKNRDPDSLPVEWPTLVARLQDWADQIGAMPGCKMTERKSRGLPKPLKKLLDSVVTAVEAFVSHARLCGDTTTAGDIVPSGFGVTVERFWEGVCFAVNEAQGWIMLHGIPPLPPGQETLRGFKELPPELQEVSEYLTAITWPLARERRDALDRLNDGTLPMEALAAIFPALHKPGNAKRRFVVRVDRLDRLEELALILRFHMGKPRQPQKTPSKRGIPAEPHLLDVHVAVLRRLRQVGMAQHRSQLCTALTVHGKGAIHSAVSELHAWRYVQGPSGGKRGVSLTDAGRTALAEWERKAAATEQE